MTANQLSSRQLIIQALWRLLAGILILGAMFFWPAGTLFYWEAWLYLAVLFIPMSFVLAYLIKNEPELLERRLRMREKETEQKLIIKLASIFFLVAFLLPGFDKRYGWSSVPPAVVIIADVIVLLGYAFFAFVLKENRYASRIIEVEQEQNVITTGPYSLVRHPMYLAVLVMYVFSPLALGSYWAMIPTILLPILLVARIQNEERILLQELEGYREYTQQTKYRLIPGIW